MKDPIIMGDYLTANPMEPEKIDPRIYQDVGEFQKAKEKFD